MNGRPPLFRPEVTALREAGAPLGASGLSWAAVAGIVALTVLLAVGFSLLTSVSRKQTLSGYLQPVGGAIPILSPRNGVLSSVEVATGTTVRSGDRLFVVETRGDLEQGGTLAAVRTAALERQIASLRSRIAAEEGRSGLEAAEAQVRLAGLRSEARSLSEQRDTQIARIAATAERLQSIAPIRAKGYISEDEYRNREEYLLSLRQALSGIDRQLAENLRERNRAAIGARQVPAALAGRIGALRSELADLERQRIEAGAEGAELVRAPVAGRILGLRAEKGRAVTSGIPVLTIAPGRTALKAVLLAPPALVGLIRPGQHVRLIYDAFPPARFGAQSGVVRSVSTAALPDGGHDGPARYRIDVALERQSVAAYGAEVPLQADMTLKADVMLEKRSLLEWLLQPLLSARARR